MSLVKFEIKSVGVWSFTKMSFFINLIGGFLLGLLYAIFLGFFVAVFSQIPGGPGGMPFGDEGAPMGILLVALPIIFSIGGAVFNTIIGVVLVGLYNLGARLFGGLELKMNSVEVVTPPPDSQPYYAATPSTPPPPPSTPPPVTKVPPPKEPPRPDIGGDLSNDSNS